MEHWIGHIILLVLFTAVIASAVLLACHAIDDFKKAREIERKNKTTPPSMR